MGRQRLTLRFLTGLLERRFGGNPPGDRLSHSATVSLLAAVARGRFAEIGCRVPGLYLKQSASSGLRDFGFSILVCFRRLRRN